MYIKFSQNTDLKESFIFRLQQKSFPKDYMLAGFLSLISSDGIWKLLEPVYREHPHRADMHS